MRRSFVCLALAGSLACGPLVPIDEGGGDGNDEDTGKTSADDGRPDPDATRGDDDGVPPNPSDPSGDPDESGGDPTAATTATTGPIDPDCGNGELDDGEECDDGDNDDSDECSAHCTISVEVEWTVTYDAAGSFDVANDVVLGPNDDVWVVGSVRNGSSGSDVWLAQIATDGTFPAMMVWDGVEGLDDEGHALAWTPDGHLVIVGSTESDATGDDVLVLLVDPATMSAVWTNVFDGPGSGDGEYDEIDVGTEVAVDPFGGIVLGATLRVGPGDYDAWVGELLGTGEFQTWSHTLAGGNGERDEARALLVDGSGGVALLAAFDEGAQTSVSYYGDAGREMGAVGLDGWPQDMAARQDGSSAIVGSFEEDFGDTGIRVAVLDAGFSELWSAEITPAGNNEAFGLGVAVGPSDEVAAVGSRGTDGESANGWVGAYRPDGAPWWGATYNNGEANLNDTYHAVVFDSVGRVIVVGSETVLGQQTNALVRRYRPL